MNAPTPPGRKVAKPQTKRPRKPLPPQPKADAVMAEPPAAKAMPTSEATQRAPGPAEAREAVAQKAPETPTAAPSPTPKHLAPREAPRPEQREERHDQREERRENRGREERRDGRRPEPPPQGRREEPEHGVRAPEMGPPPRGLTLLGAKTTVYSDRYTPAVLEAFENRHPENDYFVKFNCPEFTSLCPITGQPDFATLYISYIPDRKMVESKSLKLYLFGFRNHGAFHEDCVNIIMKDLIKLMAPRYIEVWGRFLPRGGLSIDPYANYGRPTTRWEEFARQRLLMHDLSPEQVDNR